MLVKLIVENHKANEIQEIHFIKVNSFYEIKEYLYNIGFGNITFLNNKCLYSISLDLSFYPKRVKLLDLEKEINIIKAQNSFRNDIKQIKLINNIKG